MFINTGRCFQNVEERFRAIGFDGYVCGCGTNIYYQGKELLYVNQTHETVMELLTQARKTDVDILFESRQEVVFDLSRPLHHPDAKRQYYAFRERHYDMSHELESEDYICDKFVIWFERDEQLTEFRKVSDRLSSALTGVETSGNLCHTTIQRRRESSFCWTILHYPGRTPMRLETATTTCRCFCMYRTAWRWEMPHRRRYLNR